MTGISVLTLVKGRAGHLAQLLEGLSRGDRWPDELVIVDMADKPLVSLPDLPFPALTLHLPDSVLDQGLMLAQARNLAARTARCGSLLFLDVDCIPMRGLVGEMAGQLAKYDALICAEIRYLGPDDARGSWCEDDLRRSATPHPVRDFPDAGLKHCENPGLFWSVAFGVRRATFMNIGGFDEAFKGYGAEDTDFGFRAHQANLPLKFLGGAQRGVGAFHQHHPVFDPPLQHFADIVRNARLFHARWKVWPMEGWLQRFTTMGLIDIARDELHVLRHPSSSDLTNAYSPNRRF